MSECCEKNLEAAADNLGKAMQNAPKEEKEILKAVYARVQEFAKVHAAGGGDELDVSAAFAMAIVGNTQVNDEAVIKAAAEYIDQDLEFCRSRNAK